MNKIFEMLDLTNPLLADEILLKAMQEQEPEFDFNQKSQLESNLAFLCTKYNLSKSLDYLLNTQESEFFNYTRNETETIFDFLHPELSLELFKKILDKRQSNLKTDLKLTQTMWFYHDEQYGLDKSLEEDLISTRLDALWDYYATQELNNISEYIVENIHQVKLFHFLAKKSNTIITDAFKYKIKQFLNGSPSFYNYNFDISLKKQTYENFLNEMDKLNEQEFNLKNYSNLISNTQKELSQPISAFNTQYEDNLIKVSMLLNHAQSLYKTKGLIPTLIDTLIQNPTKQVTNFEDKKFTKHLYDLCDKYQIKAIKIDFTNFAEKEIKKIPQMIQNSLVAIQKIFYLAPHEIGNNKLNVVIQNHENGSGTARHDTIIINIDKKNDSYTESIFVHEYTHFLQFQSGIFNHHSTSDFSRAWMKIQDIIFNKAFYTKKEVKDLSLTHIEKNITDETLKALITNIVNQHYDAKDFNIQSFKDEIKKINNPDNGRHLELIAFSEAFKNQNKSSFQYALWSAFSNIWKVDKAYWNMPVEIHARLNQQQVIDNFNNKNWFETIVVPVENEKQSAKIKPHLEKFNQLMVSIIKDKYQWTKEDRKAYKNKLKQKIQSSRAIEKPHNDIKFTQ